MTLRDGVVEAGEFIEYDSLSYSLCSTHLNTHLSHLAKRAAETGYTLSVE